LCLLNYWDKWSAKGPAKWTDARKGNCSFKGWSNDAYQQFDSICNRIRAQRETDESKAMEMGFLDYAIKQYGRGTKRTWTGILDEGPEIFNELVDKVLSRLNECGLKINATKSFFARTELDYLGYWIT
jgi:hypothetical protein